MKICTVGGEFFHADGRTNRHDEADSRFAILRTRLKRTSNIPDCLFRNTAHTGMSGLSTNGTSMASLSTNIAGLLTAVCLGRSHADGTQ
jgi:hypothetical protein